MKKPKRLKPQQNIKRSSGERGTTPPSDGSNRPEVLLELLKGITFIILILVIKVALEHTQIGKGIESSGHVLVQRYLTTEDLPVQVVDISDMEVSETKSNGRTYRATPRDKLENLIQAIVDQEPKAIGIDIDFSPDSAGYLTPGDPEFFQFCLDQPVPIFLGVERTQVLPPEAWFADPRYERLGASIMVREDTRKMPSLMQTSPNFKPGKVMGAELGKTIGETRCKVGELLRREGLAEISVNKDLGDGGKLTEFVVDYGPLDALIDKKTLRTISPEVIKGQGERFHNKIVIIGRVTMGIAKDLFDVEGHKGSVPGAYIHACAAYTVAKSPLYELTLKGRLTIDAIMSGVVLLAAIGIRRGLQKRTTRIISDSKLHTLLTVLVVIVAITLGIGLVKITCVIWSDCILALGVVVLHPSIVRRLSGLWKLIKKRLPPIIGDLISEGDEEVRK